jgi:diguanylate cyclase (GGDEF)-like protein
MDEFAVHAPSLLLMSALPVGLVACVMAAAGPDQQAHRGYRLWVAAQWLLAGGLLLWFVAPGSVVAQWLARCLVLQWPVLVLLGLRRFHGRQPLRGRPLIDIVLLAAGLLAVSTEAAIATSALTWIVAQALLHGYVAVLVAAMPAARESMPLRLLAGLLAAAAAAGAAVGLAETRGVDAVMLAPVMAALLGVAMGFVALLLTQDRTVRELRESRRRLRYLANIDMLTQVPNRRHFGELARRALQRQVERMGAVLMFDIDHFKRINDELGHAAGDRALRLVSQCLQETLRTDDVAGRQGGDEFVLLLPGIELRDAMSVAMRIVVRAQQLAARQGLPELSLSFGMVQMRADESLDEAIRRADQALYEAKRQGRGRAVSADGNEHQPVFVESRRLGLV